MISRCTDPNAVGYREYGGRDIRVCKRWLIFENFIADMSSRPSEEHSLDRRENDKGYEPGNCRWATREEQANNRSDNLRITYRGETLTATEWSRRMNLPRHTIYNRYHMGLTEDQLFAPSVSKPREAVPRHANGSIRVRTPEHIAWTAMKQRCTNPKHQVWAKYGGAGVTVCQRWLDSFDAFLADLGPRPSSQHSLYRKDKTLPYEPGNCFWATKEEQVRGSRAVHIITYGNRMLSLIGWEETTGISVETIRSRFRRGWSTGQALGFEPKPVIGPKPGPR